MRESQISSFLYFDFFPLTKSKVRDAALNEIKMRTYDPDSKIERLVEFT